MRTALLALGGLLGLAANLAVAGPVDTDPNKEYLLTADAGPWLICAASYVGPKSKELAHEMVMQIRHLYHLPAYVLNRGEEERKKQQEEFERLRAQHPDAKGPIRRTRIEDQCAVLVGGYKDIDSAHKALIEFKKLPPPSDERLFDFMTRVRPDPSQKDPDRGIIEVAPINPFAKSFVARNPLVPREAKHHGPDPMLKQFNADESYSLLKCKKPWTLLVAAYQGPSFIVPDSHKNSILDKFLGGGSQPDVMAATGKNAHELAKVMRQLDFEAYVLHTRYGSVVTVGEFDSQDDPRMQRVRMALADNVRLSQGGILLPQPMAMEVPRP